MYIFAAFSLFGLTVKHCSSLLLFGKVGRWQGADYRVTWRPGQGGQKAYCPSHREFLGKVSLLTIYLYNEIAHFFFDIKM